MSAQMSARKSVRKKGVMKTAKVNVITKQEKKRTLANLDVKKHVVLKRKKLSSFV